MSMILLGVLGAQAAGAGVDYWLSVLDGTTSAFPRYITTDSDNNIYIAGTVDDDTAVQKIDSSGNVVWQRKLLSTDGAWGVGVDSAGNVYVPFLAFPAISGQARDFCLAKYNSSGTLQWQVVLYSSSDDWPQGIAIDSSDNIYVVGLTEYTLSGEMLLAKYDTSGTLAWQRIVGGATRTAADEGFAVATDSSGNIYITGRSQSYADNSNEAPLIKYDSSGNVVWSRTLGTSGQNDYGYAITVDSSDNIYIVGTSNSEIYTAKYNASGTLQWQRKFTGSGEGYGVATDSENNVYTVGRTSAAGAGSTDAFLSKHDSSGTIVYQRVLGTTVGDQFTSISIGTNDVVYVTGSGAGAATGNNDIYLASLPNDGSLTGTYVLNSQNFIYAASTLTESAASLTSSTVTPTAGTSTLTTSTTSFTDAATTLTQYITTI